MRSHEPTHLFSGWPRRRPSCRSSGPAPRAAARADTRSDYHCCARSRRPSCRVARRQARSATSSTSSSRGRGATARASRWHTATAIRGCRRPDRRRCPRYIAQLAALDAAARAQRRRDGRALDPETRRALLDEAFTKAGVRNLPPRPTGQHVVADLMAFYFRSSEANDDCYRALISREIAGRSRYHEKAAPLG